jgi:peptidyl-prolyl cis-trans isomerase C
MKFVPKPLALWLGAAALTISSATFAQTEAKTNAAPANVAPTEAASTDAALTNAAPAKPAAKAEDLFPDPVVAKGKGFQIKRSQLDEALIAIKANLAARGQGIAPSELLALEKQILDRLIQIQLLQTRATDADKAKGKEICEKTLAGMKNRASSEEAFNRQLKVVGLTPELLRTRLTEEAVSETVLARELKVNVTDEDVKKFYDDNPARFEQPEIVRASHILLSTRDSAANAELSDEQKKAKRKQIEDILKRAKDGEDFADLAKQYSEDPGSKDSGGQYIFWRGRMVPEFEAAAFSLKTNQISDVVTTIYGHHIIKLNEKYPARKASLDDEVVISPEGHAMIKKYWPVPLANAQKASDVVRRMLETQKAQEQMPAFTAKLKQEAGVVILDEKLKTEETPKAASAEPAKSDKKETSAEPAKK